MAAFELRDTNRHESIAPEACGETLDSRKLREECIIALKIYDSCRSQDCLTPEDLGPARAAEDVSFDSYKIKEGDIIDPPDNAVSVTIDKLRIRKITIVDKDPNPFKNGYWDIEIKFVFEYILIFREANGCIIAKVRAKSIYNKCVTLFGSNESDTVFATDLFPTGSRDSKTIDSQPFILVEAKAVALSAELKYCRSRRRSDESDEMIPPRRPNEVLVTIGLFSIINLYRLVNLTVQSMGFCIPPECEEICPLNPCEFFEKLDFPMDMFVPPQKKEFFSGESSNIRFEKDEKHEKHERHDEC